MRTAVVIFAFVMAAGIVLAQDAPEKQPAQGAEGLKAKVDALVKQLGSNEFDKRESATERLKKIGKPAIPALKEALKSDDAEVRSRAESLLKELESPQTQQEKRSGSSGPSLPGLRRGTIILPEELDEQTRKTIEKLMERLEKGIGEGFSRTWRLFPGPGEKKGEEEKDLPLSETMRKRLEEIRKKFGDSQKWIEDMRKRMGESEKWFEEFRKGMEEPVGEGERIKPKTELPGEEKKGKALPLPRGDFKSGRTVIVKRLVWKDGKLVVDEQQSYDPRLPGISVSPVSDVLRYHLSLAESEGVTVSAVLQNSPFAAAGIAKHDVIISVDGRTVGSRETLAQALADKEKVTVQVVRRGKRKTFEVSLRRETRKELPPEKEK